MFLATEERLGYLPMQDHGRAGSDGGELYRQCMWGVRLLGRRDFKGGDLSPIEDPMAKGDILTGVYWPSIVSKRPHGSFSMGGRPAVVSKLGDGVKKRPKGRPMFDGSYAEDSSYQELPLWTDRSRSYPIGTPGIVLDSPLWNEQQAMFFPTGGDLVDDWLSEIAPQLSSRVYNTDEKGKRDQWAGLDTAWRVTGPLRKQGTVELTANPPPWSLAWVLTDSPGSTKKAGYGLTVGRTNTPAGGTRWSSSGARLAKIKGDPPFVAAWASSERGGPLYVGIGKTDKHHQGFTADQIPVGPLHLSASALFAYDGWYDAPLKFEKARYPFVQRAPFTVEAHIRYDRKAKHAYRGADGKRRRVNGMWRIHSYSWWRKPEDEPPPPEEEDEDPEGTPDDDEDDPRKKKKKKKKKPKGKKPKGKERLSNARALYTPAEISVPGISLKPAVKLADGRYMQEGEIRSNSAVFEQVPTVARMEAFTSTLPQYGRVTAVPAGSPSQQRYAGAGDAAGAVAFLPANRDTDDVALTATYSTPPALSCYVVAAGGTKLAVSSQLNLANASPAAGIQWSHDQATGQVSATMVADDGTDDDDSVYKLAARTCFGRAVAADAAARNGTETIAATDFVVLSAGGNTLTLPAASEKRLMIVRSVTASATTLAAAGADSVDGGASISITGDTGRLLISDGSQNWYSICC